MDGLILSNGITPIGVFLKRISRRFNKMDSEKRSFKWNMYYSYPTLFWFYSGDWFVKLVARIGLISSLAAFLGFFPAINMFISMAIYLSLKVVSQPWLGLQMHATIIETDFVYLLTVPFKSVQPLFMVFLTRFLIFRIMLGCGACKYGTGDKTWRNLTAMNYHYFTQPLPNPISWYAHKLPNWQHKMAVIGTHVVEGPLAFLAFGNQFLRLIAFMSFAGLNLMINVTGNYGFLGLLSVIQCFPLLDDQLFHLVHISTPPPTPELEGLSWMLINVLCVILGAPYVLVSLVPLVDTFHGQIPWLEETYQWLSSYSWLKAPVEKVKQLQQNSFRRVSYSRPVIKFWDPFWSKLERAYVFISPLNIINRYAKFGTMSTKRWELIVEGSNDQENWKPYEFKYKPGDVHQRPATIPFHLPGLDWRIWFLPSALRRGGYDSFPEWYQNFLLALLKGNKDVLGLLAKNPFPVNPPLYLRTVVYDYKFCYGDPKAWWFREFIVDCGAISLPETS
jgi:hypothetical protein